MSDRIQEAAEVLAKKDGRLWSVMGQADKDQYAEYAHALANAGLLATEEGRAFQVVDPSTMDRRSQTLAHWTPQYDDETEARRVEILRSRHPDGVVVRRYVTPWEAVNDE